jgi:hypothetical protein
MFGPDPAIRKGEELAEIYHAEFPDKLERLLENFRTAIPLSEENTEKVLDILIEVPINELGRLVKGFEMYLARKSIKYAHGNVLLRLSSLYMSKGGGGQRAYQASAKASG